MTKEEKNIKHFLNSLPKRIDKTHYEKITVFRAQGCDACGGLGYRGRIAIFEFLEVGRAMEDLIEKSAGEAALQEFALKEGMVTLQQDGILKVITGITTFEEVEHVTGSLPW